MGKILEYLLKRAVEKSSWISIIAYVALELGLKLTETQIDAAASLAVAVAAFLGVILPGRWLKKFIPGAK